MFFNSLYTGGQGASDGDRAQLDSSFYAPLLDSCEEKCSAPAPSSSAKRTGDEEQGVAKAAVENAQLTREVAKLRMWMLLLCTALAVTFVCGVVALVGAPTFLRYLAEDVNPALASRLSQSSMTTTDQQPALVAQSVAVGLPLSLPSTIATMTPGANECIVSAQAVTPTQQEAAEAAHGACAMIELASAAITAIQAQAQLVDRELRTTPSQPLSPPVWLEQAADTLLGAESLASQMQMLVTEHMAEVMQGGNFPLEVGMVAGSAASEVLTAASRARSMLRRAASFWPCPASGCSPQLWEPAFSVGEEPAELYDEFYYEYYGTGSYDPAEPRDEDLAPVLRAMNRAVGSLNQVMALAHNLKFHIEYVVDLEGVLQL